MFERREVVIVQNIDSAMIGAQIVDLFAPNGGPNFLADEFEDVEGVGEFGAVSSKGFGEVVADLVADCLEAGGEHAFDFGERFGGFSGCKEGANDFAM